MERIIVCTMILVLVSIIKRFIPGRLSGKMKQQEEIQKDIDLLEKYIEDSVYKALCNIREKLEEEKITMGEKIMWIGMECDRVRDTHISTYVKINRLEDKLRKIPTEKED